MKYDKSVYKGLLMQGRVREAVAYLDGFPEKAATAKRMRARLTPGAYVKRTSDPFIQGIDRAFQAYYQDVFWELMPKDAANEALYARLRPLVSDADFRALAAERLGCGTDERDITLETRIDGVEELLARAACAAGYHYLGGTTQGCFGPYIWKDTVREEYPVELPNGTQSFVVYMMDGFVSRGWLDFVSLGQIGTGGWQNDEGIFCVRKSYAKDFDKPTFTVSLLKHEAQHAYDKECFFETSSIVLEYRAKLVELIYNPTIRCFRSFFHSASAADPAQSHAYAAHLIINRLSRLVFGEEYVGDYARWQNRLKAIRKNSRICYDASYEKAERDALAGE